MKKKRKSRCGVNRAYRIDADIIHPVPGYEHEAANLSPYIRATMENKHGAIPNCLELYGYNCIMGADDQKK